MAPSPRVPNDRVSRRGVIGFDNEKCHWPSLKLRGHLAVLDIADIQPHTHHSCDAYGLAGVLGDIHAGHSVLEPPKRQPPCDGDESEDDCSHCQRNPHPCVSYTPLLHSVNTISTHRHRPEGERIFQP